MLTIPVVALGKPIRDSGKPAAGQGNRFEVQVLDEQGALQARTVTIGTRNRVLAEVIDGLEEGEKVVTSGLPAASAENGRSPRRFM